MYKVYDFYKDRDFGELVFTTTSYDKCTDFIDDYKSETFGECDLQIVFTRQYRRIKKRQGS